MSVTPPINIIRISAPGKIILHGEHSVVYDKLAVAASLGLRTRLEYQEIESKTDVVTLEFPALNLLHFYRLQDIVELLERPLHLSKAPSNYNLNHPEVINHCEFLQEIAGFIQEKSGSHPLQPNQQQALMVFFYLFCGILGSVDTEMRHFKLKIDTELSISAGTGSSASFVVVIAAFLLQYVKMKKCKSKNFYKNFKINSTKICNFDKTELDLISKWAFQAEKIIHGTPSGVDNTICTYGSIVEFRRSISPKLVNITTELNVLLINTNVPRDTKVMVQKVATMRSKHKKIVDGILELMDETAENALGCIKKINGKMGDEFDTLEHYENLQELAEINHNLLRCLGVSHPKLDEACRILAENGLRGKLTGAGGGGYAISLVPPHTSKTTVDNVIDELNSKGFSAILTNLGGQGVSID